MSLVGYEQVEREGRYHMFALDLEKYKSLLKQISGKHIDMKSKTIFIRFLKHIPSHHKTICEVFNFSKSSYYRIVCNEDKVLSKSDHSSNNRRIAHMSEEDKELIKLAVKLQKKPLVLPDLIIMISTFLGESISYNRIRSFMKNELKYSYK